MNESNHWFWFFSIAVANKTPAGLAGAAGNKLNDLSGCSNGSLELTIFFGLAPLHPFFLLVSLAATRCSRCRSMLPWEPPLRIDGDDDGARQAEHEWRILRKNPLVVQGE